MQHRKLCKPLRMLKQPGCWCLRHKTLRCRLPHSGCPVQVLTLFVACGLGALFTSLGVNSP